MFAACSRPRRSSPARSRWRAGVVHPADRHVDGARDVAESTGVALEAAVLGRGTGVEERRLRGAEQAADVGRRQAQLRSVRAGVKVVGSAGASGQASVPPRHRSIFRVPGGEPAIEDPDRLESVGPQRPPHAGGVERLRVVVDHDGHPVARSRPAPPTAATRSAPARRMRVPILIGLDEVGPPIDMDGPRDPPRAVDVGPGPVRSPSRVEDADLGAPELLAEPLGRGQELGAGEAGHRRLSYGRAPPPTPARGRERLAEVRAALPALGAGIYLNTGTSGPLPAETPRS